MKNKIYNLIASLASLVLGVILLVCICLAWYVTNDFAKVEGVTGITSKGDFYDISLTRYVATEVEGQENTYTKGAALHTVDQTTILPYDELSSYTKVIYEISFSTNLQQFTLNLKNTSRRTNSFTKENSKYYNYLSNVAIFTKLKIDNSNFTIDASDTTKYFCDYSSFSDDLIHQVSIYANQSVTETRITLYLLFDYNKDHINQLYSANLGVNDTIYFKDDLTFVLSN